MREYAIVLETLMHSSCNQIDRNSREPTIKRGPAYEFTENMIWN